MILHVLFMSLFGQYLYISTDYVQLEGRDTEALGIWNNLTESHEQTQAPTTLNSHQLRAVESQLETRKYPNSGTI